MRPHRSRLGLCLVSLCSVVLFCLRFEGRFCRLLLVVRVSICCVWAFGSSYFASSKLSFGWSAFWVRRSFRSAPSYIGSFHPELALVCSNASLPWLGGWISVSCVWFMARLVFVTYFSSFVSRLRCPLTRHLTLWFSSFRLPFGSFSFFRLALRTPLSYVPYISHFPSSPRLPRVHVANLLPSLPPILAYL